MYLKSLEIRGFKSFADKTELKFKKGVTAVVGPNGSGKSNISDSVRWVLGEQSVKTLRGGKMEDVIFAGTQYRKPVGLAQVSLTLDNEDGGLNTEYNEVTVSRRIFRSGETEYLINGTKCRLKDITQLFMDTGIGKEGYSLIGQGKIEAVLSGKPEERRALLEEAAGIVKFKSRKEEAEKKLDNTDANLVRIRDIISTYEERLEPLAKEREKALKYKEISEVLNEKEVSLYVHFIKEIEEVLKDYQDDLSLKQKELQIKKNSLYEEKERLNNIKAMVEEIERKNSENKNAYYDKKENITKMSNEILLINEKINNLNINIKKNSSELENINNKLQFIKEEKEKAEIELEESRNKKKEKEKEILSYEENSKKISINISEIENKIKNLKDNQFELLRGHSEIKNALALIDSDIKGKNENLNNITLSIKTIEGNLKINSATLEGLINKNKIINEEIEILETGINEKKKKITAYTTKNNKMDSFIKELTKKVNEIEANKNILSNLEKHYEGYNRTVKNLMERIESKKIANADGTKVLGEIFKVKKEYETAVEIALGGAISNVITENDKIAKELISYLKNNSLGRATFLPLNNINGNKLSLSNDITNVEGYIGIASDIVSYDKKYEVAINNVLGRTIVCNNMDSALKISKISRNSYRIVTLEGELIAPGGALTGGSIQKKFTNILGRKREIEELAENLKNKKQELVQKTNEYETLRVIIKELDEEILNDKDRIHFKGIEKAKNESEIHTLEIEGKRLKESLELSKDEILRTEKDIIKLKEKLVLKNKELEQLEGENFSNKDKSIKLEETLQSEKEKSVKISEKITELKINKASIDEALTNKLSEVYRKSNEIDEYTEKYENICEENNENNHEVEKLKNSIIEKEELIEKEKEEIEVLSSLFKEDEIKKAKYKDEINIKETSINELSEIINKEEGEINKKEIQKAKAEMEKDNLYTKLNEELSLTLAEAMDIAVEINEPELIKAEISRLKGKVTALGTVNLAAISEYEEVKEKYEEMYVQEQDLEKAKSELNEVIQELTEKMKEVFKENFKILNENFNETFKELFKGGSAELILGEGDELSANIDINVEPPGKKLQNINLMSGGEKVLSAIALLFAILKMKPTPFCILDEIEAALDDANVYRYAEFLKEFSEGTQFIVITHRKGTMEASDVMYGVTMEEKGISKVVSVDLAEV
ncbi:MAG: chromosome segregation protein SMC [Clostridiales bacterium]|nr:chromosome segregation protein SMC [Clostridiales bacterium]